MTECECLTWARENQHPSEVHHRTCIHYKPLRIWYDGESDYVIAETAEDARKMQVEACGSEDDVPPLKDWYQINPAKVIHIDDDDGDVARAMTGKEWIEREGRGFLCSNNY
jgi:hypothetical protein